jgi:hypothetical protein
MRSACFCRGNERPGIFEFNSKQQNAEIGLTLFVALPQIGKQEWEIESGRETQKNIRVKNKEEQRTCVRCSLAYTLPQVFRQTANY